MNKSLKLCLTLKILTNFWTALRYCLFCGCSSGVSNLGFIHQFYTNLALSCLLVIILVPIFFCGQDNLLGGQFWAMGRFKLGGQNNLLGGQICPPS